MFWLLSCLVIFAATLALFRLRAIAVKFLASTIAVSVVQNVYAFSNDSYSEIPIWLIIGGAIISMVLFVSVYAYSRRLLFRGILK